MKHLLLLVGVLAALSVVSCSPASSNGNGQTYSVTYHGNGNDTGAPPTDAMAHSEGETVSVLDNVGSVPLAQTGFQFGGWNTQFDGLGSSYGSSGSFFSMPASNVDLWAVWIPSGFLFTSDGLGIGITGASSSPSGALVIPPGVTKIGLYAFQTCTAVTSLSLPGSLVALNQYAFDGCTGISSVTIPSRVSLIPFASFSHCTSLTSVTLGAGVTDISYTAFDSDSSLSSITLIPTVPPTLEATAFDTLAAGLQIYVPAGYASTYKAAAVWVSYQSKIQ